MGRRPQVTSCHSEGLSYEKCNQVRSIIAGQKSGSKKCVVAYPRAVCILPVATKARPLFPPLLYATSVRS